MYYEAKIPAAAHRNSHESYTFNARSWDPGHGGTRLEVQIRDAQFYLLVPRIDGFLTSLGETVGEEHTTGWRLRISFPPARPTRSFGEVFE